MQEFNLLIHLYQINSRSRREERMLSFIGKELQRMRIPFKTDGKGQIFTRPEDYDPSLPLLSVHTDQVQDKSPSSPSHFLIEGEKISAPGYGLGADDKNGIWIVLTLMDFLKGRKLPFSFIFSTEEETGRGNVLEALHRMVGKPRQSFPRFALVLDRKGSGDIIGSFNGYCSKEFEMSVHRFSLQKGYGYKPSHGVFSDADFLRRYMECVNLSVGYENAHTPMESCDLKALRKSRRFVLDIVRNAEKFVVREPAPPVSIEFTREEITELAAILFDREREMYMRNDPRQKLVSDMTDKVINVQ